MEPRMVQVGDVALHVGVTGHGPDVIVLTGGPGCVQYLERDEISPLYHRAWYPEPRGVGRSGGGPHTMEQAIADLEGIRAAVGVDAWIVVGHSWGCDLGVRYAVEHPQAVAAVVGIAGKGPQRDRTWSEAYEAGKATEPVVDIDWVPEVHEALGDSFTDWIHRPDLWRGLAGCGVPMHFIAAGDDIRPPWPLAQLAALVPRGKLSTVPGVPHDFWFTHPEVWTKTVTDACTASHPSHYSSSSQAIAVTCVRCAGVNRRGRPGRCASASPPSRANAYRQRHLRTVSSHTARSRATPALVPPSAAASTIRARSTCRAWTLGRVNATRTARSSSDNTIWYGLVGGIATDHPHRMPTPPDRSPIRQV